MTTPTNIIEKIRKLQALSERAGTEAEAACAAQKIAELCHAHNLEIGVATLIEEEQSASESQHVHGSAVWQAHWSSLGKACDALFNVGHYRKNVNEVVKNTSGMVLGANKQQAIVFYGLRANVESAILAYEKMDGVPKPTDPQNAFYPKPN